MLPLERSGQCLSLRFEKLTKQSHTNFERAAFFSCSRVQASGASRSYKSSEREKRERRRRKEGRDEKSKQTQTKQHHDIRSLRATTRD